MPEARTFTVSEDDDGIRLDRWFKRHMPDVSFNIVSRWSRTGQLRVDDKKAVPGDRIETGQKIRIPPADAAPARTARPRETRAPRRRDRCAAAPQGPCACAGPRRFPSRQAARRCVRP